MSVAHRFEPAVGAKRMASLGRLTFEEERGLAEAIETRRCPDARDRLMKAHAELVVAIAHRYVDRGLSYFELVQAGNSGLERGIEHFDSSREIRFSTWASWWIKHAIRTAIAEAARTLQLVGAVPGRVERTEATRHSHDAALRVTLAELPFEGRGRADPHTAVVRH